MIEGDPSLKFSLLSKTNRRDWHKSCSEVGKNYDNLRLYYSCLLYRNDFNYLRLLIFDLLAPDIWRELKKIFFQVTHFLIIDKASEIALQVVAIILFEVEIKLVFEVLTLRFKSLSRSSVLYHFPMFVSDVLYQLVLPVVLRSALSAFISPKITLNFLRLILLVLLMSTSVISHVAHTLEFLVTNLAGVGSLSTVCAHVDFEVAFLEEGLLTYRA